MINIHDLTPLKNELETKEATFMGIKTKINLYVIDKKTSVPILLTPGQLVTIWQSFPNRTRIVFEAPEKDSNGNWNHSGKYDDYGCHDLLISEKDYANFFRDRLESSPKKETTYLTIIGLLIDTMLSTTSNNQKLSVFTSQSAIIDYLINHYPALYGISKSTLEEKFSNANKVIKQKLPQTPAKAS